MIEEAIGECSVGVLNKVNIECLLIALLQERKKKSTAIDLVDPPHVHYMVKTLAVTSVNTVRKRKSIGRHEPHLMKLLDLFSRGFLICCINAAEKV